MTMPWEDYAAASQAAPPPPAPAHADDPQGPWKDFMPAGKLASPQPTYSDRPLTIHGSERPGPEIEADPSDRRAVAAAVNTLDPNNQPGPITSGLRGAAQGMTFNFGDEMRGLSGAAGYSGPGSELVGGVRMGAEALAPGVFGHGATDRYDQALSQARAENELASDQNPASYFAGELAGGAATLPVAPALTPFKAAEGAGIVSQGLNGLANMAATGAVYGAPAGFGGAQGGIEDRLKGAATGAALGGVINPAFGSVAAAVGGAGGRAADFMRRDLMARNDPGQLADQIVARRMAQDGSTPDSLIQSMTTPPAPVMQAGAAVAPQGPPAPNGMLTAADVGGPNLQGLAGTIARTPGEAQTATRAMIQDRQVGSDTVPSQADRANTAITQMMGGKNLAADAVEQITAKRSAEATPFYEAARATPIDYTSASGKALMADLDRVPSSARVNANNILKVSDKSGTQLIFDPTPDANGMHKLMGAPNVRQWDYIKQGIDQLIDGHTDALTGRVDTYGHALVGLKNDLLSNLDEQVPAYKNARRIFAGHSEMIRAVREGADAFRPGNSAEDVAKALKQFGSKAEKEAYRMSAAKGLKDILAPKPDMADKTRFIAGSPDLRAKVALIAPDEASQMQLMNFIRDERAMNKLRGQIGNSATAERLSSDTNVTEGLEKIREGVHVIKDIAHMNVPALFTALVRHLSKVSPELRSQVLEEARKIILNPDPNALRSFEDRVRASSQIAPGPREAFLGTLRNFVSKSTKALPRAIVGAATQTLPDTQTRERKDREGPRPTH